MPKADSTQKNVRLRNDTWFEVEDLQARWECSRDTALERAVNEAHGSGVDLSAAVVPGASLGALREIVAPTAPKAVGGPPLRYKCEHCGKAQRVARIGETCAGCVESGHEQKDVRTCSGCWLPS